MSFTKLNNAENHTAVGSINKRYTINFNNVRCLLQKMFLFGGGGGSFSGKKS